jgi:hypothetical protein
MLLAVVPRLRDSRQALFPLILSRNPSIPGRREKLVRIAIFLSKPETAVLRLTRRKETPAQEPQGIPETG